MDLVAAICTALRWRRHRLGLPQRVSEASFWDRRRGERPRNPNAPQLDGTGEILLESADRASGYFITRSTSDPTLRARTSGVYWRAEADELGILDGRDDQKRAALIAERLKQWNAIKGA